MTLELISDHREVITELDQAWKAEVFRTWNGRPMIRLAGSVHDQESMGDNPLWEVVRNLPVDPHMFEGTRHAIEVDGWPHVIEGAGRTRWPVRREQLCKTYSWAIPTPGDVDWIKTQLDGRAVVEVGAGTGYWAWQLSQAQVDVRAYDVEPGGNHFCGPTAYHPVLRGGYEAAASYPDRALMLCWPPYDSPMAAEALKAYAGDLVISIGEPDGGCTGDEEYFALLGKEFEEIGNSPKHVTYSGIHCWVTAYRRIGGVS